MTIPIPPHAQEATLPEAIGSNGPSTQLAETLDLFDNIVEPSSTIHLGAGTPQAGKKLHIRVWQPIEVSIEQFHLSTTTHLCILNYSSLHALPAATSQRRCPKLALVKNINTIHTFNRRKPNTNKGAGFMIGRTAREALLAAQSSLNFHDAPLYIATIYSPGVCTVARIK